MTLVTRRRDVRVFADAMHSYKSVVLEVEREAVQDHGIVSRVEARRSGMSDHAIDGCVASGRWFKIHPGIFRVASHPLTFRGRCMAATKWAGEGSFLSHGSTLTLEGVDGVGQEEIHVTALTGGRTPGIVVHRLRRPARTHMRYGIRTCRVERALLDTCARKSAISCGHAMDDLLRRRLTTLDRLSAELDAAGRGVRGCAVFRKLLEGRDDRDGKLASKLEARLFSILRRIEEYNLEVQFVISTQGKTYRLDFYYPDRRLGIEGQSLRWHLANDWIKKDWARHNALTRSGLTMLYYSWDDVHFGANEVEAEVREMLASSTAVGGGSLF